jgi:glycosyltransferase involved in cell wall biosynthesis
MSLLEKLPTKPYAKAGWPWEVETDPCIYDLNVEWPKISIVTPSYNQGQFIEETIRTVLLQNYPNLEYIIIDGGSTDNTIEVIKKYEPYITYWVSEKDEGQSHAINKGLEQCTGAIFNWVNSDDVLLEGGLLKVAKRFLCSSYDVVCFSTLVFQQDEVLNINKPTGYPKKAYEAIAVPHLNQLGMFWNLSVIECLGGVNQKFHYVMDLALWIKYLCVFHQTKVYVDVGENPIGGFRFHQKSKTILEDNGEIFNSAFFKEFDIIYSCLRKGDHPGFPFKDKYVFEKRKKIYALYKFNLGVKLYYNQEKKRSFQTFIKINPFLLGKKEIIDFLYILKLAFLDLWK